jgi:hypothetical protein
MTSYNQLDVPFVYPPLGLLGAALVGAVSGAETRDVLRVLPPLVSVAVLFSFAFLAWRLLPKPAALLAVICFGLMPSAFDALVAGGGVPRGLGLSLALVGVAVANNERGQKARTAVFSGGLIGLALLAHPQAGVFGVAAALVTTSRRDARWLMFAGLSAATAALVVAPWLALLIARGQLGDLLAAGQRWEPLVGLIRSLNLEFSGAIFMDVFAAFGLVGAVASMWTGRWRVLVLLLATYLAGAGAAGFLGAVPWSLLAGVGAAAVVEVVGTATDGGSRRQVARVFGGALLLFMALIASLGSAAGSSSKLHRLTPAQVQAMDWIAANTPRDAPFLVVTTVVWGDDEFSEWFPAVTDRYSVATVQGTEWLGARAFEEQLATHFALLACSRSTADCYADLVTDEGRGQTYLVVPKGKLAGAFSSDDCCPALRATLDAAGFDVVYDGPGATVATIGAAR